MRRSPAPLLALFVPLSPLVLGCNPDASLKVNNSVPTAKISSPADGAAVAEGATVELRGTVGDSNHATSELSATWMGDGVELCAAATPATDGTTTCSASFPPGSVDIVLQVQDPSSASATDTITLDVIPGDTPVVDIVEPDGSGRFYAGEPFTVAALVSDTEDAPDVLVLAWESSLDGVLGLPTTADSDGGVGGSLSLSEGSHELRLSATDSDGYTGSATVTLEVGAENEAPDCAVTAPESPHAVEVGATVSFAGTVGDSTERPSDLVISWSSDKDGALGTSTADTDGSVSFSTSGLSVETHTVTLHVEDELGEVCTDSVVVTVGNRPEVSIDSPSSGDVVNEGAVVAFSGTVSDAEDAAVDLEIAWLSDVDGGLSTVAADSAGLTAFNTDTLSPGPHIVTLEVTDSDTLVGRDTVSITVNGLPTAPVVELLPDPAVTDDDLSVSITTDATDPEGASLSYSYAWSKNGVVQSHLTSTTVAASETARGETWLVEVSASDGTGSGPAGSDTVTIANTAPEVTGITWTPSSPGTDDLLTPVVAFADADGDSVSFSYAWTVNGSAVSATGSTLDGTSWFEKGDTVEVTVTPTDGTDTGSPVSASVLIVNTPPSVSSVTLSPSAVQTDDLLTALAGATQDADGDTVSLSYAWTVGGVSTGTTATTLDGSTYFDKGDVVVVTVTPDDGTDAGSAVSDSVTVLNTAPTDPVIGVDPDPPQAGLDDLICEILTPSTDADGDTITYSITWTVDGIDYPDGDTGAGWLGPDTTTYTDDTVPADDMMEGELWTCTVVAEDGTAMSSAVSASTTTESGACGNGTVDSGEEYDPAPGPFSTVAVDTGTCRWDFSGVEQLYCNGSCTWAGGSGCDQADADILCKLVTDNPGATAISWTATTALPQEGFPCTPLGYGSTINVSGRGVSVPVSWQDASILGNHGPGDVVAYPICNVP